MRSAPRLSASLTHDQARRVPDAGSAEAEGIDQPMNTAVVDDGGHLAAFGRVDGVIEASIDTSTREAVTSILMAAPIEALTALVQPGAELHGLEQTAGGLVASAAVCRCTATARSQEPSVSARDRWSRTSPSPPRPLLRWRAEPALPGVPCWPDGHG